MSFVVRQEKDRVARRPLLLVIGASAVAFASTLAIAALLLGLGPERTTPRTRTPVMETHEDGLRKREADRQKLERGPLPIERAMDLVASDPARYAP